MTTAFFRRCTTLVLLWALAVFGAAPAFAQLEEVIVTAQKREESLQDVPLSVSAISGDMVRKMDYTQIEQISELVPNFNMGQAPGEYTINIRGIGSATSNRAFEQSVGLYVDGVYTGRSQQFQAPFLDMERIEVVRGPQGVLFGKNSNAGAVNITSAKPSQEFYSSLRGTYEFEYGGWDFEGVLNGRMTDTLSGRLAVKKELEGAYMENSAGADGPKTKLGAVRASMMWNPSDALQVYFKVDYSNVNWQGVDFQVLHFSPAAQGFYLSKDPLSEDVFDLRQQLDGDFLAGGGIENAVEATGFVLQADYTVGENVITYLGSYSKYKSQLGIDTDFGGFPATYSSGGDKFDQVSQELRLTSPGGEKFDYIAGLYYLDRHYQIPDWEFDAQFSELPPPFPNFTRYRNYDEKSELWSGFFQGTWNFNDQWSATAGIRYVHENKDADILQKRTALGNINMPPPPGIPPFLFPDYTFHGDRSESSWNPSASLQWQPQEEIMFYASYNSAEKAGGFNSNSSVPIGIEYEPEKAKGVELCTKTQLLDNTVRLNVALFSTKFTDYQVSSYNGVVQTVTNAASATSKGVEVEFSWAASDKLTINAQAAYLNAKYDRFPEAPCAPVNQPDCIDGNYRDASGERLTYAPKYSGSVYGTLVQPISDNLDLNMQLTGIFSSDYDTQIDKSEGTVADSFFMLNARLGISNKDDTWGVALIGQNLTDKRLFNFAANLPFFPGSYFANTLNPRLIKLEAIFHFN